MYICIIVASTVVTDYIIVAGFSHATLTMITFISNPSKCAKYCNRAIIATTYGSYLPSPPFIGYYSYLSLCYYLTRPSAKCRHQKFIETCCRILII